MNKIDKTEMLKRADYVLGVFSVNDWEPNQDSYVSQDIPFDVETILEGNAIYCVQQKPYGGAVIVGEDGSFLVTGHTRKGKQYLIDKWLAGDRTDPDFIRFYFY